MQITPKSRSEIQEYADIAQLIDTAAGHINGTYADVSWTPVRYISKAYSRTALAGLYRSARVGLVTPLRDGMNLVAKEYVAAQNEMDPGVLILSRFAGGAAELASALLVNPYDPEAVGAAIARALSMPMEERIARHSRLFEALLVNDIKDWGNRFLAALTNGELQPGTDIEPAAEQQTGGAGANTEAKAYPPAAPPGGTMSAQALRVSGARPQAPERSRPARPKASTRHPKDSR